MNRSRWAWGAAGLALVAAGGCGLDVTSSEDDAGDEGRSSASESPEQRPDDPGPDSTAEPTAGPTSEPGSESGGPCPVGTWRLRDLHAIGDAEAARIEFSGGGSLTFAFATDGAWTLTDDGSRPLHAVLTDGGYRAEGEAVIDGTATGTYRPVGSAYSFDLESASGEAELSGSGYQQTIGMGEVARDLVPSGLATLDCDEDRLRLDSDSVTMRLALVPTGRPEPPTDPGGDLTVGSSGTQDCSGRSVTVDAELEDVVLEGECDVVTVVSDNTEVRIGSVRELVVASSLNEIFVEAVDTISISGSSNEIFWNAADGGGEPAIQDSGPFNTVQQRQ